MNGAHDMGGGMGFGPVVPEPNEPIFHADWERGVLALTLAMGFHGKWNIDTSRYYRENRSPSEYLNFTYYQIWFAALEQLLLEHGFITADELRVGRALMPPAKDPPPNPANVARALERGFPANVPADIPARFQLGQKVKVRDMTTTGHTRAPRYTRGRVGEVVRDHGIFIFPDTHAMKQGQKPQHLYNIRFQARELWGDYAAANDAVHVDMWDDYLDLAP